MLFDLSMTELMLIGVVALVVIGPKDLPKALKVAGFWVRKARTLSREFQSSVEQMIREAELDEMRQQLKKASEFDVEKEFRNTIDPGGSLAESLKPPELPKFSEADLPAASASTPETLPEPAAEGSRIETGASVPGIAPPHGPPADLSQGEPPLPTPTATPADPGNGPPEPAVRGGAHGSGQDSAAPGVPPTRE
jgi:sec-independent protein translocase protein TatB